MDEILFVVDAESVHQDVDADAEGIFALCLIARDYGKGPVAEAIAFPCTRVIVHGVEDGATIVDGDAFDIGFAEDASAKAADQVERSVDGVFDGEFL